MSCIHCSRVLSESVHIVKTRPFLQCTLNIHLVGVASDCVKADGREARRTREGCKAAFDVAGDRSPDGWEPSSSTVSARCGSKDSSAADNLGKFDHSSRSGSPSLPMNWIVAVICQALELRLDFKITPLVSILPKNCGPCQ